MTGTLDAAGYDAWFDAPWGSYAFHVEREALLDVVGPLIDRQVVDVGSGTVRFTYGPALERIGRLLPPAGAFQIAVVAL